MNDFLSAIIGAVFGGGALLLADHIRYLRRSRERSYEVLAEERVKTCLTLLSLFGDLFAAVDSLGRGVRGLRNPTDPKTQGDEDAKKHVEEVAAKSYKLHEYLWFNAAALGKEVFLKGFYHFIIFSQIRGKVQDFAQPQYNDLAISTVFDKLTQICPHDLAEVIDQAAFEKPDISLSTPQERMASWRRAHAKTEELLDEAASEFPTKP
ncbi:MAG: hypothetical protein HQ592_06125 [Planctomycetes bacterium]|nr:hypothetical protein [Planctomycetota bacterium]